MSTDEVKIYSGVIRRSVTALLTEDYTVDLRLQAVLAGNTTAMANTQSIPPPWSRNDMCSGQGLAGDSKLTLCVHCRVFFV